MRASSRIGLIPFGIGIVLAALEPNAAAQNTWYVDDDGTPTGTGSPGDPYPTIRLAMSNYVLQGGDTIVVRPGTYRERVHFTRGVALVGEGGAAQTIIDAGHRGSAVTVRHQFAHESRLEGFTLRNGTGNYSAAKGQAFGGGIFCLNSRLVVVDCTIRGNSTRVGGPDSELAGHGGGIFGGTNADLVVLGCTIADNDAVDGGGISLERGSLQMQSGNVSGNRALGSAFEPGRGGGIHVRAYGRLDLAGVDVLGNLAMGSVFSVEALGGGLCLEARSSAAIAGSVIAMNDSGGWSLGYGDLAGFGGGVSSMAAADDFTMISTSVRDNWGNSGGGGVHGKGRLDSCVIEGNHGQFGGGVHAVEVTLHDCVLRSNRGSVSGSYDWGGGIYVGPGRFGRLESCDIDGNHAWGQGGGGWGGTYVDCDIRGNFATGDGGAGFVAGGGVFGGDLAGCRVWDNTCEEFDYFTGEGGGLYACRASSSLVHDNQADSFGAAASSQFERSTVAHNLSTVSTEALGASSLHDSIARFNFPVDLAGNSSATWSNVPPGIPGTGNISNDPMFVDAAGRDYRLQTGSPCIDAGDPSSPPDPDGSRADMGALPFGS